MHRYVVAATMTLLFGIPACGTAELGEAELEEGVASADEAVASADEALTTRFSWLAGDAPRRLGATSDHVCILTSVRGKFEGDREWVRVVPRDGFFWLEGSSAQPSVSAEATCISRNEFATNRVGFSTTDTAAAWKDCDFYCGGSDECTSNARDLWFGDSTVILNGIGGRFWHDRQIAEVRMPAAGWGEPATVFARTCHKTRDSTVMASGMSFTALPGRTARFIGPDGVGAWQDAGEFSVASTGGRTRSATLPPVNQAMCHLTHVSGALRSENDHVTLRRTSIGGVLRWSLEARTTSTEALRAKARCYALDQR